MKLRELVGRRWHNLSLRKQESIETYVLSSLNLPAIGLIYNRLYYATIKKKVLLGLRGIQTITIETNNVCNLRCLMCPYPDMTRKKVLMSMDLFTKIIDDAVSLGIKRAYLNLYNEPLLDPLLFERIKYAKNKGLYVFFNSNGSSLTQKKMADILESGLDCILFSLNAATAETYEKVMGGKNFEKTQNSIIDLIKERNKVNSKTPFIGIGAVLQSCNYHEEKEFQAFWKGLADSVSLAKVDSRGVDGLLPWKEKLKLKYRYPCPDLFSNIIVLSDGRIALCCFDYDGSVILGDLTRETIKEAWNSEKYHDIREIHLNGQGDKIQLCRKKKCGKIGKEGAFYWWF